MVHQNKKPSSLMKQNHETNWMEQCKFYSNFIESSSDDSFKHLKKMNQQFFDNSRISKKKDKKKNELDESNDNNSDNIVLPQSVKQTYEKQLKLNLFGDPDNPEVIE